MSLSELGATLQRYREEQGLSLEAVEEATRIRRVHLEAIEAGRWESLPPGVYVRGLLKSYAKVLGLSPETVLRMYLKERPQEEGPTEPRAVLSQPLLREPRLSLESVLAVIFIAAAAAIGWWLWLAFVGPMLRSPAPGTPTVAATAGAAAGATPSVPPTRAVARPTTGSGIPTAVELLPLESPSPEGGATAAGATNAPGGTAPATAATATGATAATAGSPPSATRPAGAAASATARATGTPPPAPATASPRPGTPGGPSATPRPTTFAGGLRLSLRSTGSIWVSVVLDGKRPPAFEGFLRKGENDLWEGQARTVINLRTGNAGETEVSLNGQRLPSLGKAGEVKNVEWRLLPDGRVQQTP